MANITQTTVVVLWAVNPTDSIRTAFEGVEALPPPPSDVYAC